MRGKEEKMQVTITIQQLINSARLSRKAYAAMCEGANATPDLRDVFLAALAYNEEQANAIPALGTTDIFGEEWTAHRRMIEGNEHGDAHSEIITLARAVGVEL